MMNLNDIDEWVLIFSIEDHVDLDSLNEAAALISDPDVGSYVWDCILKIAEHLTSKSKQEAIGIAVFELMAEDPVHPLWLDYLPGVLSKRNLYWIIFYSYRNNKEKLFEHITMLQNEMPGAL